MKVLSVNKYYQHTGGGDRFFFETNEILEKSGHVVVPFCLNYKGNKPTPYLKYFPGGVAGSELAAVGPWQKVRLFMNGIYSHEARKAIGRVIADERPDVAHLHILHFTMSPSVIDELHRQNVPIVFSLHDYRVGCVGGYLYRNGHECTLCAPHKFYEAVIHKCYQGSRSASLMGALGNYLYALRGLYSKVDAFTVPHEDMKRRVMQFGLPAEKIHILRNPLLVKNLPPRPARSVPSIGADVLFFGNLSAQKGVLTLLKAAELLPHIPFRICGTGIALPVMQREIESKGIRNVAIDTASRWNSGLQELIAAARIVVSPSEWPTPLEYSTLEAMSLGKAVLASYAGGNRDVIVDGETGIFFRSGDHADLARKIEALHGDPEKCEQIGANARRSIEEDFNETRYGAELETLFRKVVAEHVASR
ncbi:MAG TPA: glycosyltransferase family 4 protein [Gallionellaceae bacterium]